MVVTAHGGAAGEDGATGSLLKTEVEELIYNDAIVFQFRRSKQSSSEE
jgi:hypothetical protein